jgi:hypothetical protein
MRIGLMFLRIIRGEQAEALSERGDKPGLHIGRQLAPHKVHFQPRSPESLIIPRRGFHLIGKRAPYRRMKSSSGPAPA